MEQKDGGPAYPCLDVVYPNGYAAQGKQGMSLRDHFAGLAMQALIANNVPITTNALCCEAYGYADAMIRARENGA